MSWTWLHRVKLLITTYQEVNDLFRSNTCCDDENERAGSNTSLPEQHFSIIKKGKFLIMITLLLWQMILINDKIWLCLFHLYTEKKCRIINPQKWFMTQKSVYEHDLPFHKPFLRVDYSTLFFSVLVLS